MRVRFFTSKERISFAQLLFVGFGLNMINRPFARYVLLRKRRGILRAVVITPDQPEIFVEKVRGKIQDLPTTD